MRASYLLRVLAGATFGVYMAHLLYFLNPQIEITPLRLVRAIVLYGITCGVLFGTALWLLGHIRTRLEETSEDAAGRSHGFGLVVGATFISAGVFWLHAIVFRIFLPVGAIRILTKATNLIAVTAFALLLIWLLERNAARTTSRFLIGLGCLLIAVSSVVLYQRRDRYRFDTKAAVVANVGVVAGTRPLLVITIEELPHDWLITMIGEERLPFLETAIEQSFFTRLDPFPASSSKARWASLATGKLPHRHGVTGRFSYRSPLLGTTADDRFLIVPEGVGFRGWGLLPPVRRLSAQLPAGESLPFWNLFERLGFPASVIGWPGTSASSPMASMLVTESFFRKGPIAAEIHPPQLYGWAYREWTRSTSISPAVSIHFGRPGSRSERAFSRAISSDRAAARMALDRLGQGASLTVLSLGGLSEALESISLSSNELPDARDPRGAGLRAYLGAIDTLLGELASGAPDVTMVLVSISGPRPPALAVNPIALAADFFGAGDPGADDGFILVRGRGSVHRANPAPALIVDLVPTLLFLAGLPVARDMDGRVLTEVFDDEMLRTNALSLIQTYEGGSLLVRRDAR